MSVSAISQFVLHIACNWLHCGLRCKYSCSIV